MARSTASFGRQIFMDVTCERCGTEYDFDETLVSDRGTTVKCTNCGHLFKVFRGSAPSGEANKAWTVRKRDGTTSTLSSLRDLQRMITRGELHERDMISRAGEGWKRLGDIAELQSFFTAARSAPPAAPASAPRAGGRRDTLDVESGPAPTPYAKAPSSRPAPIAQSQDARAYARTVLDPAAPPAVLRGGPISEPPRAPPPSRPPTPTITGPGVPPPQPRRQMTLVGVGEDGLPIAPPTPTARPAAPAAPPAPPVANAPSAPERISVGTRPLGSNVGPTPAATGRLITPTRTEEREAPRSTPPRFRGATEPAKTPPRANKPKGPRLHVDEMDEPARPPPSSGSGRAIVAVLVTLLLGAGAVGIGLNWNRIAPLLGGGEPIAAEDPVAPLLVEAEAALARDDVEGYESAVTTLVRAGAVHEDDPRVLAMLSQVNGEWAQAIAFEAADIEARSGAEAVTTLRAQQRRKTEDAKRDAERALQLDPRNVRAMIALANALRLAGELDPAGAQLTAARAIEGEASSAEWLYVSALVAMDRDHNVASAHSGAMQALFKEETLIRASLLLARALAATGQSAEAVAKLDGILARVPDHGPAASLKASIANASVDGGVPDAGPVAEVAAADASTAVRPGETSLPRDYDVLIERGNAMLERGDHGNARRMFEQALRQRATGVEALTGLGDVAMNTSDYARATSYFQQATARNFPDAYIGLGEAMRRSGRPREALTAYERYLEINPNGSQANVARNQARRLRDELGEAATPSGPGPAAGPAGTPLTTPVEPGTTPPPGPGSTGDAPGTTTDPTGTPPSPPPTTTPDPDPPPFDTPTATP